MTEPYATKFGMPIVDTMSEKPSKFDTQIGEAIRTARKNRGWSQTQLSSRTKISRGALSNYERGRPVPTRTLSDIAIALEIKPGHFFSEAEKGGQTRKGEAAAKAQRIAQIHAELDSCNLQTLEAIVKILDIARSS